jgi:hypothetical protein
MSTLLLLLVCLQGALLPGVLWRFVLQVLLLLLGAAAAGWRCGALVLLYSDAVADAAGCVGLQGDAS